MTSAVRLNSLVERIRQLIPGIPAIYLYGSRARGEQHPGSDLDIALLLPRDGAIAAPDLAQLQGDLESMVGCPVEISILSPENQTVHCKEVVTGGKILYVGNRRAVDEFEMYVLSSYARLCEDRAQVVEAYAGRADGRCPTEQSRNH